MNCYSVLKLIGNTRYDIEFSKGVSTFWIKKAEERLGVKFSPSYFWWLSNYGKGEVNGEEIFGIYEVDFDQIVGGDIVYMNELNRRSNILNSNQLMIQFTDFGEFFYFDMSILNSDYEYPICSNFRHRYAENFWEFLEKRIKE